MECLYRQHLILPVAFFDSAIGDWTASVHIEFTEKLKVHTVVLCIAFAFANMAIANAAHSGSQRIQAH
jgi:hypothetical protein